MGLIKQTAPTREQLFWSFCRVLANETRLRLLSEIIGSSPLSVAELSVRVNTLKNNASIQLKELDTYGLIFPSRRKQSVYYSIRNSPMGIYPEIVLPSLTKALKSNFKPEKIIHLTTAFTHQRRIEIVNMLSGFPRTTDDLLGSSNIKRSALARHLSKLENRGFVVQAGTSFCLSCPQDKLGAALLKAALHRQKNSEG